MRAWKLITKSYLEENRSDFIFIKSDRRFYKVELEDILFVEGLKDYVILQTRQRKLITKTTLKAITELLPVQVFMRINRSYIVNMDRIESFDNKDVYIDSFEIAIGNSYREEFFQKFVARNTVSSR